MNIKKVLCKIRNLASYIIHAINHYCGSHASIMIKIDIASMDVLRSCFMESTTSLPKTVCINK